MTVHNDLCEKEPSKLAIVLYTLIIFAAMHLWHPFLAPLSSVEALQALTAKDLMEGGGAVRLIGADGYLTQYPLYSLVLSFLGRFLPLTEYVCRVPGILAILGMTIGVAYSAARSAGHRAGLTAASVVMASVGIGLANVEGNILLAGFLVASGWIVWYRASRLWNLSWLMVWLISLFPVFTALWAIGLNAIFVFYLPLFFMRRPLKARKRLSQIQHVIVVAFYTALFILLKQNLFPENVVVEVHSGVPSGMLEFLALSVLFCFPWCFIGWPIFCMAFQGVEKTPVFNQYVRTILITVFLVLALFSRDIKLLAPLLPIFAIGAGVHYDIFMRRYYLQVRYVGRLLIVVMGIIALWSLVLVGLVYFNVGDWSVLSLREVLTSLVIVFMSLLVVLLLFLLKKRFMIYSCRLAIITACFITSSFSARAVLSSDFDYENKVAALGEKLESYTTVYLLLDRTCYQEAYYLQRKVVNVKSAEQLPDDELVYVLTNGEAPILETREWQLISSGEFPAGNLALWRGKKRPELISK